MQLVRFWLGKQLRNLETESRYNRTGEALGVQLHHQVEGASPTVCHQVWGMIEEGREIRLLIEIKTVIMSHFQIIPWLPVNKRNAH